MKLRYKIFHFAKILNPDFGYSVYRNQEDLRVGEIYYNSIIKAWVFQPITRPFLFTKDQLFEIGNFMKQLKIKKEN